MAVSQKEATWSRKGKEADGTQRDSYAHREGGVTPNPTAREGVAILKGGSTPVGVLISEGVSEAIPEGDSAGTRAVPVGGSTPDGVLISEGVGEAMPEGVSAGARAVPVGGPTPAGVLIPEEAGEAIPEGVSAGARAVREGGREDDSELVPFRLFTPRECARLQGFPETFLLSGEGASGEGIEVGEAAQYVGLGNAVSPPVVRAIARALLDAVA